MSKLRIMSNNLWWRDENSKYWKERGEDCSAQARTPGFVRVYNETLPDIVGLQECSSVMRDIFMELFSQSEAPYTLLYGRDTPIIYRKDKLELIDHEFVIYPETVEGVEGSFNNEKTKSYCIAVFRIKENGRLLIFASTHLWYKSPADQPCSDIARKHQLGMLIDKIGILKQKYNCPAIAVGDLNDTYSSVALSMALERGYVHAYDVAKGNRDSTCGMHGCNKFGYEKSPDPKTFFEAIDHILLTPDIAVDCFERYAPEYYMPLSDHAPVFIDIEI